MGQNVCSFTAKRPGTETSAVHSDHTAVASHSIRSFVRKQLSGGRFNSPERASISELAGLDKAWTVGADDDELMAFELELTNNDTGYRFQRQ